MRKIERNISGARDRWGIFVLRTRGRGCIFGTVTDKVDFTENLFSSAKSNAAADQYRVRVTNDR